MHTSHVPGTPILDEHRRTGKPGGSVHVMKKRSSARGVHTELAKLATIHNKIASFKQNSIHGLFASYNAKLSSS